MNLWQWLQQLGPAEWAIIGVVLIVAELAINTAYLLWIGLAALLLALLMLVVPLPIGGQCLLFALLSVAITLVGRCYYNPRQVKSAEPELNQLGRRHLGQRYLLDEDAHAGRGVVKIGDSRWQVSLSGCDNAAKGSLVEVIEQHDSRLVVKVIAPPES